jgi:hypothetical protein
MDDIEPGSLVIVHCSNPREKFWGVLVRLDVVGAIVRGLDLNSVEDWLLQERSEADGLIRPSTFFVPLHRVVRIDLEEQGGVVPGYGERYGDACGRDVREALVGRDGTPDRGGA